MNKLLHATRPMIVAHRGDSSRAPENTLIAFRLGAAAKADMIELDYFHAAGGEPVVFHDKNLKRTTDAAKTLGRADTPISEVSLDDLKKLDAGSWFNARFRGSKIPTLEESLDVIQATTSFTLIEHKDGDAKTCIELLNRKKMLEDVAVMSFNWSYVADCRALSDKLALGALGGKEFTAEKLDEIEKLNVQFIGWDHNYIGKPQIAEAHRRGFRLYVYTVDDPIKAGKLLSWGIDGIITNRPLQMRRLVPVER